MAPGGASNLPGALGLLVVVVVAVRQALGHVDHGILRPIHDIFETPEPAARQRPDRPAPAGLLIVEQRHIPQRHRLAAPRGRLRPGSPRLVEQIQFRLRGVARGVAVVVRGIPPPVPPGADAADRPRFGYFVAVPFFFFFALGLASVSAVSPAFGFVQDSPACRSLYFDSASDR